MDLSRVEDKEIQLRIESLMKMSDWVYLEEGINRQLRIAYKGLRSADDLHRVGKFQGLIQAYRWVLQDVDK